MKFTALYKVEIYDEVAGTGTLVECGLVYAENMRDAVAQLEQYYGEDNLITIHYLEMFDMSVFTFGEKHLPAIKNIINEVFE